MIAPTAAASLPAICQCFYAPAQTSSPQCLNFWLSTMFSTKCELFTTFCIADSLFSSTYRLFSQKQGVGYARPNNQMTSLFISLQKGKKPRIAWGEAIRGLGDNYEDWAVRSSLKLSVARPL